MVNVPSPVPLLILPNRSPVEMDFGILERPVKTVLKILLIFVLLNVVTDLKNLLSNAIIERITAKMVNVPLFVNL
jgi:hypothetical protein